jgi:hypothetical protein
MRACSDCTDDSMFSSIDRSSTSDVGITAFRSTFSLLLTLIEDYKLEYSIQHCINEHHDLRLVTSNDLNAFSLTVIDSANDELSTSDWSRRVNNCFLILLSNGHTITFCKFCFLLLLFDLLKVAGPYRLLILFRYSFLSRLRAGISSLFSFAKVLCPIAGSLTFNRELFSVSFVCSRCDCGGYCCVVSVS